MIKIGFAMHIANVAWGCFSAFALYIYTDNVASATVAARQYPIVANSRTE